MISSSVTHAQTTALGSSQRGSYDLLSTATTYRLFRARLKALLLSDSPRGEDFSPFFHLIMVVTD